MPALRFLSRSFFLFVNIMLGLRVPEGGIQAICFGEQFSMAAALYEFSLVKNGDVMTETA